MRMKTEADAFACLAVLVAGIDGLGTMEEREFLFGTMAGMPVFEGLDRDRFAALLSEASTWFSDAPRTREGHLSDDGMTSVLGQICERLSPERRGEAFQMALELARVDDMSGEEQRLMDRLRIHLLPPS